MTGIEILPLPEKFTKIEDLKTYLLGIRTFFSYRLIGEAYGVNKGIVWKIVNSDYEPQTYEIRAAFGLPVRVMVQAVNGFIEPGSISLGSKVCSKCERPFISNTGKRKLCYRCLKPRDRKAEAQKRMEKTK